MTDDEALIREQREQIAETREDLAEKVEAIREKVDVRHRGEQKLRGWQTTLTDSAKQLRQSFDSSRVRELGESAVAAGWRHKAAEGIAPRVAGSAPMSGGEVRAALGLVFLAMSASYVLKTLLAARRQPDVGRPQLPSRHARTPLQPAYVVVASHRRPRAARPPRRMPSRRGGQS